MRAEGSIKPNSRKGGADMLAGNKGVDSSILPPNSQLSVSKIEDCATRAHFVQEYWMSTMRLSHVPTTRRVGTKGLLMLTLHTHEAVWYCRDLVTPAWNSPQQWDVGHVST